MSAQPDQELGDVLELRKPTARALQKLELYTCQDLLAHYPRRYENRSLEGDFPLESTAGKIAFVGKIFDISPRFYGRSRLFEMTVGEQSESALSGRVTCRWFNMNYLAKHFKVGQFIALYGKVKTSGKRLLIDHAEYEVLEEEDFDPDEGGLHVGRITPVYASGKGVSQKLLRRVIFRLLDSLDPSDWPELLPLSARLPEQDPSSAPFRLEALKNIHFPASVEQRDQARRYLALEEMTSLQLGVLKRKRVALQFPRDEIPIEEKLWNSFLATLPFDLTGAQQRTIAEIRKDLCAGVPMCRLLQGDVGSGKTVVAVAALLFAIEQGKSAAFMAPTQILAEQHYMLLKKWLEPVGVRVALRTSSRSEENYLELFAQDSQPQIWVGTHALLYDKADIDPPDLVVIDEQHKFGVEQRDRLINKGKHPDLLVMTATPIPRTLTLTLYGDLEVSLLDESPGNRGEVVTALREKPAMREVSKFLIDQISLGRQVFIVYPLVEDSKSVSASAAETEHPKWCKRLSPHKVGLIHGRLSGEQKEKVMTEFRNGGYQVLVGTTVIEVGIDVPNASVMLIYNAERFGLSQLHQLRGRIGRGAHKSYCVLMSNGKDEETRQKLMTLVEHRNGFEIAEKDLEMRGPGEILGSRQSGISGLKLGDLMTDTDLVLLAREIATEILDSDPDLEEGSHQKLASLNSLSQSPLAVS